MITAQKLERLRARCLNDPGFWVRQALGITPTPYQNAFLSGLARADRITIRSCHGIGKSGFAGMMAVPWFMAMHPGGQVITTAPTHRQVEGIIWRNIATAHNLAKRNGHPIGGKLNKTKWDIQEDWFAMGFTSSPTNTDGFQGFHPKSGWGLVVVDEAAGIDQRVFDQGIAPILSSGGSQLLLIGNPTNPVGTFRRSHDPGSGYLRFKIDAFMTPNFRAFGITQEDIANGEWEAKLQDPARPGERYPLPAPYLVTPKWVAEAHRNWGFKSDLYQGRVMAEFPTSDDMNLLPIHLLELARERDLPKAGLPRAGLDPAGEGADFAVMGCMWPTGRYRTVWNMAKTKDSLDVANRVQHYLRLEVGGVDQPTDVVVDAGGMGDGTQAFLSTQSIWHAEKDRRILFHKFLGSYKSRYPLKFANARAEAYWRLREMAQAGELDIDPKDEKLFYQLSEIRYKRKGDQIIIEPKDEFKARTSGSKFGGSPDAADAMSMSVAHATKGGGIVVGG